MKVNKVILFNSIYFISVTLIYSVRWFVFTELIMGTTLESGKSIAAGIYLWVLIACISALIYPILHFLLIKRKAFFINGLIAVLLANTLGYMIPGLNNIFQNFIYGLGLPLMVLFSMLIPTFSYTVSYFIMKILTANIKDV